MERSQSCSNFQTTTTSSSTSTTTTTTNTVTCSSLRRLTNNKPTQLKQANSQKNLSTMPNANAAHLTNYPTTTTLRRKNFQRQRSATFSDDTDYAADMDDEEDYEDGEIMHAHYETAMPTIQNSYARQRTNFHPTLPAQPEGNYIINRHTVAADIVHYAANNFKRTTAILPAATIPNVHHYKRDESFDSITTTTDTTPSPTSPRQHFASTAILMRDNSLHSDSSRYSSVDSLLDARKPDPEAILINLGFGPIGTDDILTRIPKRFLKPSQVRGNDTEAFVKRLQLANNLADHSVLGYRGLTGNPDIPPSSIVAKIMQRFEVNERKKSMGSIEHAI